MKKCFIVLLISVLLSNSIFGQTLQATITQGSTANSIYIKVKSKTSAYSPAVPISTINFCLQISNSVLVKPTLSTVEILPATAVGQYTINDVSAETAAQGFYTWNIDGTDGTTVTTWLANEEKNFIEVFFNNSPNNTAIVRLVHLPDGGATGASTFYLSVGGITQHIENELFYGPTAVNNTAGVYPLGTAVVTLPGVSLPVKFLGFNVNKKNNDALLSWQIENETSVTDRYEIERSLNGNDFKKIATVQANFTGNSRNSYELSDMNLSSIRASGIFYYRIKQFDKDGQFLYSDIRNLRLNALGLAIGVYPNPVKGFANLTIDSEQDASAVITINDASGKQVQNIQMPLFKGPNIKKINMASLAGGSYLLKIQTGSEVKTISVIKAN